MEEKKEPGILTTIENKFQRRILWIAIVLILLWIILSGVFYKTVLKAYTTTNLAFSLLTVFTILFAAGLTLLTVIQGVIWSIPETNIRRVNFLKIQAGMLLGAVAGLAILIVLNIASTFDSGWVKTVTVYYQIWNMPIEFLILLNIWRQVAKADLITV